jgi:hypothetical protein
MGTGEISTLIVSQLHYGGRIDRQKQVKIGCWLLPFENFVLHPVSQLRHFIIQLSVQALSRLHRRVCGYIILGLWNLAWSRPALLNLVVVVDGRENALLSLPLLI